MPVRDLEWFGGRRGRGLANRGANGIDGVTSTALGRALAGMTSVVLHRRPRLRARQQCAARALGRLARRPPGGRRRQRRRWDLLVPAPGDGAHHQRFEQLFGTPLGVDVVALAAAHGLSAARSRTLGRTGRATRTFPGPWIARVPSNRQDNVVVHDTLHTGGPGRAARRSVLRWLASLEADRPAGSGTHDGAQHRLELGRLGLGQFGDRVTVGDDATAGDEPG